MNDATTLNATDREICAALLRNGRATWRLIASAIDVPERTVARRAQAMLHSEQVRVSALITPEILGRDLAFVMRVTCEPRNLRHIARWFARRDETLWVATLASSSTVLAECHTSSDGYADFIERKVADLRIVDYAFTPIHTYHRTVRGWQTDILSPEKLAILGEDESSALRVEQATSGELDDIERGIVAQLSQDGRRPTDAIAAALGLSKAVVRKKLYDLQASDRVSIRAVIEPSLLGYPFEVLVNVHGSPEQREHAARILAADGRTRLAMDTPADGGIHALIALRHPRDLQSFLQGVSDSGAAVDAEPLLTTYKRSGYVLPAAAGDAD